MPVDTPSSRRSFIVSTTQLALIVLPAIAVPQLAQAFNEQSPSPVNVDEKGIALGGFDPVSYFSPGGPMAGKPELSSQHEGATYWFASAGNRDAFGANPAKFAPAYGGFCAMSAAMGLKRDGKPPIWKIAGDKLYLFVREEARTRWLKDVSGNIAKADECWPRIKDMAPKDL